MGDLERYALQGTVNVTSSTVGAVNVNVNVLPCIDEEIIGRARRAYARAVAAYPEGGNAYNQLAVLETLHNDQSSAAYFYLR
jgi:hypothetical protein